jgi:hypothetical protein
MLENADGANDDTDVDDEHAVPESRTSILLVGARPTPAYCKLQATPSVQAVAAASGPFIVNEPTFSRNSPLDIGK